jgi:DNA-directed RNA polymerase subunit RPC12/RpoP
MEKIYHFVCGECKNWWSHATDMVYRRGQNMSCPHCGEKRGIVKNDEDKNPRWERDVT